jgi:AcrR family transcriptional regulator
VTDTNHSTLSRRDEILEASTRLFHREGYANVGIRSIAEEVNIRSASVYYHFDSKEAILYALAKRVNEEWLRQARSLLYAGTDPREAIKHLIERAIVFAWENRDAFEVSFREIRELTPEHMTELIVYRRSYRHMVREHIERGIESGRMHVADASLAALAVINVQNGVNQWFRDPSEQRDTGRGRLAIEQVATQMSDLIADHLLA